MDAIRQNSTCVHLSGSTNIHNFRRRVCLNYQTDADKLSFAVYRNPSNINQNHSEMEPKKTEDEKFPPKRLCLLSSFDVFYKWCIVLDERNVLDQSILRQEGIFSSY